MLDSLKIPLLIASLLLSSPAWSSDLICRGSDEAGRAYQAELSDPDTTQRKLTVIHPFAGEIAAAGPELRWVQETSADTYTTERTRVLRQWILTLIVEKEYNTQEHGYLGLLILKLHHSPDETIIDVTCHKIDKI